MTPSPDVRSSRWKAVTFGLSLLLVGLIVWDGADRRATDATNPLLQNSAPQKLRSAPQTLKLGSFNIHSGKGSDGKRNLPRIAELLSDVDYVGLYEVRANSDGNQPNQAAALARLRDAAWLFAPTERQWWSDHFGNGLIHQIPVRSVFRIPLINTRGKAYRNAIVSTVALEKTDVRIIAVHVDSESDRRLQLQAMIDLFLNLKEPCVLMGDMNTLGDDPMLVSLRKQSGVRSPLHESLAVAPPSQTIDWIFTRGLTTLSAALVENTASDHPYLKAELAPTDSLQVTP